MTLILIGAFVYLFAGWYFIRPYQFAKNMWGNGLTLIFGTIMLFIWLPFMIVFLILLRKGGTGGWI